MDKPVIILRCTGPGQGCIRHASEERPYRVRLSRGWPGTPGAGSLEVGIAIGKVARIGAGAAVLANVKSGEAVLGNPATPIKI
jgi:hypothetical protein